MKTFRRRTYSLLGILGLVLMFAFQNCSQHQLDANNMNGASGSLITPGADDGSTDPGNDPAAPTAAKPIPYADHDPLEKDANRAVSATSVDPAARRTGQVVSYNPSGHAYNLVEVISRDGRTATIQRPTAKIFTLAMQMMSGQRVSDSETFQKAFQLGVIFNAKAHCKYSYSGEGSMTRWGLKALRAGSIKLSILSEDSSAASCAGVTATAVDKDLMTRYKDILASASSFLIGRDSLSITSADLKTTLVYKLNQAPISKGTPDAGIVRLRDTSWSAVSLTSPTSCGENIEPNTVCSQVLTNVMLQFIHTVKFFEGNDGLYVEANLAGCYQLSAPVSVKDNRLVVGEISTKVGTCGTAEQREADEISVLVGKIVGFEMPPAPADAPQNRSRSLVLVTERGSRIGLRSN